MEQEGRGAFAPRPLLFAAVRCLLREHRLDHVGAASGIRPDVVDARRGAAAALGLAVPGHGVLTLRVPLVRDRSNQLAACVEDTDIDIAGSFDGELDLVPPE